MKKHMLTTLRTKLNTTGAIGSLLFSCLLLCEAPQAQAVTWKTATATEVTYPGLLSPPSSYYLDNTVSHISNYSYRSSRFGQQYVELAGWSRDLSAGGGGGFTYGLANPGMPNYIGQGVETIPNAVDVRVGYLEGDAAYIVVAYFDALTHNYYCRLYPWLAPAVLGAPITYYLYSGTIDYRCNLDINYNASKIAITWCTNQALFTATGVLSGGGIQFSPGLPPTSPAMMIQTTGVSHFAADVAFRRDPSGVETLHYVYYDLYSNVIDQIQIPFASLYSSSGGYLYSGIVDNNPVMPSTPSKVIIPRLDCPDIGPNRWAYTYTEDDMNIIVRLGVGSSGSNINVNGGSLPITPINSFSNMNPCLAYNQAGTGFFVSWGTAATSMNYTSAQSYVALELNLGGGLVSAKDYLLTAANPNVEASLIPLISLSKHANSMSHLYTALCQYPNPTNTDYALQHKNHPWASSSTWRGTGVASVSASSATLSVAPNPFSNTLSISSTNNEATTVTLNDLLGRQLARYNGDLSSVNAQLSEFGNTLVPGTYLLSVSQGADKNKVFKIVKQ